MDGLHEITLRRLWEYRPTAEQPGTLREQMLAVAAYLDSDQDARRRDPAGRWEAARRTCIPHARRVVALAEPSR